MRHINFLNCYQIQKFDSLSIDLFRSSDEWKHWHRWRKCDSVLQHNSSIKKQSCHSSHLVQRRRRSCLQVSQFISDNLNVNHLYSITTSCRKSCLNLFRQTLQKKGNSSNECKKWDTKWQSKFFLIKQPSACPNSHFVPLEEITFGHLNWESFSITWQ